ncbi:MAG: hypothetical protein M3680_14065, partial [Myxococcota bacterium]|nr:hypothetical protein [Myxococcota bacterium]
VAAEDADARPPDPPTPADPPSRRRSTTTSPRPPDPISPTITVDRTDAARPTVFVLRGQTHGGQSFCEAFTTLETCTSACTAKLRPSMLTKPTPASPKGCSCNEQDRGC